MGGQEGEEGGAAPLLQASYAASKVAGEWLHSALHVAICQGIHSAPEADPQSTIARALHPREPPDAASAAVTGRQATWTWQLRVVVGASLTRSGLVLKSLLAHGAVQQQL